MLNNKSNTIKYLLLILLVIFLAACSNTNDSDNVLVQGRIELASESVSLEKSTIETASYNKGVSQNIKPALFNPQEYIIKFNQTVEKNYIKNNLLGDKAKIIRKISEDMYKIAIVDKNDNQFINSLEENPEIEYIEPDYLVQIQSFPPDDPAFSQQWNLHILNLEEVWQSYQGNGDVTIAVLDTGILPDHPDLAKNIVEGYDFVDDDYEPTDTDPDFSHGTHVAGIIGATSNNAEGISGINRGVNIMPIRVIGPGGTGGYSALIAGIYHAVDRGANIINLSLAGHVNSQSLHDAVKYAVENQVTVVAASGNENSSPILYPARYPEVISVGAIGPDMKRASYSNYGSSLDIVAPGGNSNSHSYNYNTVLSTAGYMTDNGPVHEYTWSQGTSMAAPHVSALIAILYGNGITDPEEIRALIKDTADDLGDSGYDEEYGAGLININRALGIESGENNNDGHSDSDNKDSDNKDSDSHSDSAIQVVAINQKSGEEKISSVNSLNKNFNLALSPGKWTIYAQVDDYKGEIEINVPEEDSFVIHLNESQ
ncbi:MAG: S8 family peptidase [Halanaerobiaceae bacterium]